MCFSTCCSFFHQKPNADDLDEVLSATLVVFSDSSYALYYEAGVQGFLGKNNGAVKSFLLNLVESSSMTPADTLGTLMAKSQLCDRPLPYLVIRASN